MIKLMTIALAVSLTLWVFFYLPKRLKAGPGARLRYTVFTVLALVLAAVLLKTFL
jgi:hypothetical protein